ncbi:MAG: hypothetical protein WD990_11650 [Acidimicrobiia bacterium]
MSARSWIPSAGFAVVWIVAATITPDVTYHLAPVIVAAAPVSSRDRLAPTWPLFAFAFTAVVAFGLARFDLLQGPSLLPVGGALLESVVGAVAGAVIGTVLARRGVAAPDHDAQGTGGGTSPEPR